MKGSSKLEKYKLDPDILAEFSAVGLKCSRKIAWTDEQDALILAFWVKSDKVTFSKKFREKYGVGSHTTILARFRELTETPDPLGPDEYKLMVPEKGV